MNICNLSTSVRLLLSSLSKPARGESGRSTLKQTVISCKNSNEISNSVKLDSSFAFFFVPLLITIHVTNMQGSLRSYKDILSLLWKTISRTTSQKSAFKRDKTFKRPLYCENLPPIKGLFFEKKLHLFLKNRLLLVRKALLGGKIGRKAWGNALF